MTVTREEIQDALSLLDGRNNDIVVFIKRKHEMDTIHQVLEDRLNQVDYKSLAEEIYNVIKTLESCMESDNEINFKRTSGKGKNAMWLDIEQAISKYKQAIKGGE